MDWKIYSLICLLFLLALDGMAQDSVSQPATKLNGNERGIVVPSSAAALVRPILDEISKGYQHDEQKLNKLLYNLTTTQGPAADEALVVLMCFDIGESQEETDAVIARGKKMLRLLRKYQNKNPKIPDRRYPDSMLKGAAMKEDTFEGAIKAIKHGWHGTSDNPEG